MQTPDGLKSIRQRPSGSRSSSITTTTDVQSPSALSPMSPMPILSTVHPPPAYVANSAASQFVSDAHLHAIQSANTEEDDAYTTSQDEVLFSDPALGLINSFLDHLLYRFLSTAKSPTLRPIRSAVENVLKGKLGRLAVLKAQTDLEDLLDEDEVFQDEDTTESSPEWDTNACFRRTRLRVMVYMRLGEVEDEDEEEYLEELGEGGEDLGDDDTPEDRRLVSAAGAIFLTCILEFVAEVCLAIAGQAAYKRAVSQRTPRSRNGESPASSVRQIAVSQADVEKAGLDARLTRLWRAWRHKARGPNFEHTRTNSGVKSGNTSRKASVSSLRPEMVGQAASEVQPPLPEMVEESRTPTMSMADGEDGQQTAGGIREPASPLPRPEIARVVTASKQRPRSLNIPSQNAVALAETGMNSNDRRTFEKSGRPQTLPSSPAIWRGAATPDHDHPELPTKVDGGEEDVEAGQDNETTQNSDMPQRSPLPRSLSSHPVTAVEPSGENRSWMDLSEATAPVYDQNTAEKLRSRTASSSGSPVVSSPPKENHSSPSSSSRTSTSFDEASPRSGSRPGSAVPKRASKVKESELRTVPENQMAHSALRNDVFPRLDTGYTTAPTTPSSHPLSPSSPYSGRTTSPLGPPLAAGWSGAEDGQSWVRKQSGASKRSRSSSKTSPREIATDIRRPSKETIASTHSNGSSGKSERVVERPFSQLIADRGTIRMKLTPKQLQNIETPQVPAEAEENNYVDIQEAQPVQYGNAKVVTPTRTYVTSPYAPSPITEELTRSTSPRAPLSATRPSQTNLKPTKTGYVPKEARVQTERLDDFAHFIRHTGPSPRAGSPITNGEIERSGTGSRVASRLTSSKRNSIEFPRSAPATKSNFDDRPPPLPTSAGPHLMAREASVAKARSPNSDLIDFLRAGPPANTITGQSNTRATPTTNQPFLRSSDTRSNVSTSVRSSSLMSQSAHGSINSHSALLQSQATPVKPYQTSTPPSTLPVHHEHNYPAYGGSDDVAQDSGRKTYRNKDPYALPSDDEDDYYPNEHEQISALSTSSYQARAAAAGIGAAATTSNGADTPKQTYRNKDPYALPPEDDYDDGEDQDEILREANGIPFPSAASNPMSGMRSQRRDQESFIDFLRNVEPPSSVATSNSTSRPFAANGGASPANGVVRNGPYQAQGSQGYGGGAVHGNAFEDAQGVGQPSSVRPAYGERTSSRLKKEKTGGSMRSRFFGGGGRKEVASTNF